MMIASLDHLPVELLNKIFHNLSAVEIYFHVSLVNRRLYTIARSYSQFHLITRDPQFRKLCTELSPSQICSMSLNGTCFDQFSMFSQLDHLRSLNLTGVPNECFSLTIDCLVEMMPQLTLTLFRIRDEQIVSSDRRTRDFIRFALTLQNLREVAFYQPNTILALESAVPTIEHIHLESITFTEMCKLNEYRPNLRFLSVKHIKFNPVQSMISSPNKIFSNAEYHLSTCVFQFNEIETHLMKNILFVNLAVLLSSLTHLSIQQSAVKNEHWKTFFDGSSWENSLKTSMPLLKSFAFEFLSHETITIEEARLILIPFQTDYWLNEKQWYVYFISSPACQSRLFTNQFRRDQHEMTDINASIKMSTDQSILSSQTITELTIDYSIGDPSSTSLKFAEQVIDLYIRGRISSSESALQYLSLNDHIRPYVDYHCVQRLRLGTRLVYEDRWQIKTGLLELFRNVRYLKIDRMEHLHSLFDQRKKVIDLISKQVHLLEIVEPIHWRFWRDLPVIKNFCRMFANVKQLDLNPQHPQIMIMMINNLLHLEEAIFRYSIATGNILFPNANSVLSKTRLQSLHWSYELFDRIIHLNIDQNEIEGNSNEVRNSHQKIIVRPVNYRPSLLGEQQNSGTWNRN